jgi:ACS family hexuronate transporter-like MFS transporter
MSDFKPDQPSRIAWLVVMLLFLGSVINYIDRAVLGVVKPLIQKDLSLTNTEYGLAVNAFLAAYTVFYILGGRLADWQGYRRMFSINVIFWSIACMLHSLVRGLGSLCLFRGLLGIGEGGFYPAAMRGATEWFGSENRAKAVGILLCGLSVGTLLTPPIVALITQRWGWRASFLVVGMFGFLLLPPWFILHRRIRHASDGRSAATAVEDIAAPSVPVLSVLKRRKYLCILLARSMTDVVWLFYLFWMPGYFQEVRGFDLGAVARLLWIPYLCGDLGALSGAWTSSGLVKRGWSVNRSRKTVLFAGASLAALGAFTPAASSAYTALGIVSLVLFAHLSWSSNIHTTITEVAPPQHVAVLYGITGAAGNGLGALAQPLIGRVVDSFGYAPAFYGTGLLYIAAMGFVLAAGRIEPVGGNRASRFSGRARANNN